MKFWEVHGMFLKTQSQCVCKLTLHFLTVGVKKVFDSVRWKVDERWQKMCQRRGYQKRKDESVYGSPMLSVIKPVIRKWQNTDPFLYKLKAFGLF